MRKSSASLGIFFLLLGLALFSVLPLALNIFARRFLLEETYFRPPVFAPNMEVRLRRDAFGKGHFGASREGGRRHHGIDILAPVGEPILAAKAGRVTFAGEGKGYGLYVRLAHPDGLSTVYAHLTRAYVSAGDWIDAETVLGTCGKSGNASNPRIKPHLHFEIQTPSGPLNPDTRLFGPTVRIKRT